MKKQYEFIQVGKTIFDYSEYVREVILLKNLIKHNASEAALIAGFTLVKNESTAYHQANILLEHKEKDLYLEIKFGKKTKEKFV